MKKACASLLTLLFITACLPFDIPGVPTATPVIVTTVAPPSPTSSPLPTPTPVLTNPSATPPAPTSSLPADTATLPPNLTATFATSTEVSGSPAATASPTTVPGLPTASATLGIRLYGTLPPYVPFTDLTIVNQSRAEAYISLQVTLNDGRYSILEYPVPRRVKVKAPLGSYVYVAWVGGRQFVGTFRLGASDSLVIYLYGDKVVLR